MWSVPYQYSKRILIRIMFVDSICRNDAHEDVWEISVEAMLPPSALFIDIHYCRA